MMTNGFKINECDKCVYVKNTERGFVIICLYVDDVLIMGGNNEVIKTTKEMFNNKFDMKDLGVADVILGIKISKTSDGLILSQSHYIEKILKKFKQNDSSPMRTPVDVNLHLSKNNGKSFSQQEYAQAIDSLMYVMNCTRPDIANTVSKLSRYTSNLGPDHWKAIVRVLRYLKYTQNYGLHCSKYPCSDPRARSNPNGESEPKPGDARFISFYFHFITFSFSKMSRPESPAQPEWRIRTGARFTPTFSFILSKHFINSFSCGSGFSFRQAHNHLQIQSNLVGP